MESLTIDILNPKAEKLLQDLADLDLIAIRRNNGKDLPALLAKLRFKSGVAPSLEDITKEVELVRTTRYEDKG